MKKKENEIEYDFFAIPLCFHDYGLQVFSHIEYDILNYILRNTIGWNRKDFVVSIKTIALMKHYNEKNIIKAINTLIDKTGVFNKIVYREKGSCIKKTKYFISDNSVEILNDYVKRNMPADFEERKKSIENRSIEAEKRLNEGKEKLLKKQQELLQEIKNAPPVYVSLGSVNLYETEITDEKQEELSNLLEAYQDIINNYDPDDMFNYTFKEYKENAYEIYLGHIPVEKEDDKIDLKLSDLIHLTDDRKTIELYNSLIKCKKMVGRQYKYFVDTLKINFHIKNERNLDRINVVFA
jgi:hypothetical protein